MRLFSILPAQFFAFPKMECNVTRSDVCACRVCVWIRRFALFRQGGQNTQITVKVSILYESKARFKKKKKLKQNPKQTKA